VLQVLSKTRLVLSLANCGGSGFILRHRTASIRRHAFDYVKNGMCINFRSTGAAPAQASITTALAV
jgi:hypothetical protein